MYRYDTAARSFVPNYVASERNLKLSLKRKRTKRAMGKWGTWIVLYAKRMEERWLCGQETWRAMEWLRLSVLSLVDRPMDLARVRWIPGRGRENVGAELKAEMQHKTEAWLQVKQIVQRSTGGTFQMCFEYSSDVHLIVSAMKLVYGQLARYLFCDAQCSEAYAADLRAALDTVRALHAACLGDNVPTAVRPKLLRAWIPVHALACSIATSTGGEYELRGLDLETEEGMGMLDGLLTEE